ncbi:MAG: 4-(cytidine 5'-diphospho)-2-C-methyl-D-erythritol kinase [Dysgonamonadaceae bacterium]|jgi:4-diphosphocytidyl-2-C-methyl-D-erythritol kinase|nr:4-(cytidine 5'-diphospho)-2-C-methyl-D-erythritol kinase [Dysgonamonadaceae bacterium]
MICFPNAKINLGLNIVSKRPDGYHNLETVFYPIPLCDALEIVPAANDETVFTPSGIVVDGDSQNNLVMKALSLLKKDFDLPYLNIYLQKHIPFGAGLGGGSADAAFMLRLLNDFANLQLTTEQLEEYAARLGADCPFFIRNRAVFAEGTGNIFSPIHLSLSGYHLVLVKPEIAVSTQEAYSSVKPETPAESIPDILQLPVDEWKNRLINDFESSVFERYPAIAQIKEKLYELGAVYASMSGSGSSVFGIFEYPEDVEDNFSGCFVYRDWLK